MPLVGLGGDAEGEVADLELGLAEEGGGVGTDEGAGHLEQLVFAGLGDGAGQFLGLRFLSSRARSLHGSFLG